MKKLSTSTLTGINIAICCASVVITIINVAVFIARIY